jgi:hypothetical protein
MVIGNEFKRIHVSTASHIISSPLFRTVGDRIGRRKKVTGVESIEFLWLVVRGFHAGLCWRGDIESYHTRCGDCWHLRNIQSFVQTESHRDSYFFFSFSFSFQFPCHARPSPFVHFGMKLITPLIARVLLMFFLHLLFISYNFLVWVS